MTRFYIEPKNLDTWLHQNAAEYTGDFVEGVLLDSFVVETRRGYAAIYESYVNPNQSRYYIEFEKGAAQKVWANWYKFEETAA